MLSLADSSHGALAGNGQRGIRLRQQTSRKSDTAGTRRCAARMACWPAIEHGGAGRQRHAKPATTRRMASSSPPGIGR